MKTEGNYFRELFRKTGKTVIPLLYPPRCPICETIVLLQEGKICPDCRKKLPYLEEPLCKKCGKPLQSQEQEYCLDCERLDHDFICGRAIFLYEKEFRRSVQRMKYQNHREYLDFYAEEMVREAGRYLKEWKPEILVPVPVNKRKKRERGFDQSILLAEKIGRLSGLPVSSGRLIRSRYTLPQKELNAKERRRNLKDAFSLRPGEKLPEPVLLIDDIYTTGATMDAVCRELKRNGIRKIYFLVLCAGKGK